MDMTGPLFDDPKRQAKLEEAIARGFIIRTQDADGILRYQLTQAGQIQWLMEKQIAAMQKKP